MSDRIKDHIISFKADSRSLKALFSHVEYQKKKGTGTSLVRVTIFYISNRKKHRGAMSVVF